MRKITHICVVHLHISTDIFLLAAPIPLSYQKRLKYKSINNQIIFYSKKQIKMKLMTGLFIAIILPVWGFSQNLIVNPGAELPPVGNGWTKVSGSWTQRKIDPLAHTGAAYFFAGAAAGTSELYQNVDVSNQAQRIDTGERQFEFISYIHTWNQNPSDESRVILEYRNAGGTVLSTFDSGLLKSVGAWQKVYDLRKAPVGTRIIKVRLFSKRNNGTNSDGYHDSLSLISK